MPDPERRPRVVIVGSGFGGLACARRLNRQPVDVILLDQHNYHLFTPLLYQVATGLLNPADIAYPLRTVFRHSPNVRFRQATVTGVDLAGKTVQVRGGPDIPYDYLVLASGSTDNYFGNQEIAQLSLGLKVLPDATRLRNHVLTCLERADAEVNPDVRRALLTFVMVGGGPTGVECSGALAELMQIVAGKDYHQISRSEIRIVLVEGLPRLLSAFSEHLGRYAQRVLERRGVEVRTRVLVKAADAQAVSLSDGTSIPCRTIVWSAGVRPNDPTEAPSVPRFRNARIKVDGWLRIPEAAGAFAIGDVASPEVGDQGQLPMLSPPFVVAASYILLFGPRGIITYNVFGLSPNILGLYGLWGVQTIAFFPYAYQLIADVLSRSDPRLEQAARNLGASPWSVFRTITVPLARPGLVSAVLLVAIYVETVSETLLPVGSRSHGAISRRRIESPSIVKR